MSSGCGSCDVDARCVFFVVFRCEASDLGSVLAEVAVKGAVERNGTYCGTLFCSGGVSTVKVCTQWTPC